MELRAAIEGLKRLRGTPGPVALFTDSSFIINGVTKWVWNWQRNNWKTQDGKDVLNQELWKELAELVQARGSANKVSWNHVPGHAGIPGNERVDEIAAAFTQGRDIFLYDGPKQNYEIDLADLKPRKDLTSMAAAKARSKATAYSYLSLVGQVPKRHRTWAECEQRVRGQTGAKFQKTLSAEDEAEILRKWGFDPKKV
jgi:ribonuclease HI